MTTRHNGTKKNHLGFVNDYFTTTFEGATYNVRRHTHADHGTGFVVKGMNDFGETYSVHHETDHGKAIVAKVLEDTNAA